MSASPAPATATRSELRQRWLERAAEAFDQLFADDQQDELVTFAQREDRAWSLGKELTVWLLEQHTGADPQARPPGEQPPGCPKCGRPGQRVTAEDQALPRRPLTTRAGEVNLQREQWRCTTCRVVFFPPRPEAATGGGGL